MTPKYQKSHQKSSSDALRAASRVGGGGRRIDSIFSGAAHTPLSGACHWEKMLKPELLMQVSEAVY